MPRRSSRSISRRRTGSVPRSRAEGATGDTGRASRSPAPPRRGRSRTARGIATPAAGEAEEVRAGVETPAQQPIEDTYSFVGDSSPAESSGQQSSARSPDASVAAGQQDQDSEESEESDSSTDTTGREQDEDDQSSGDDEEENTMSAVDKTKSAAQLIAEKMAKGDTARTKEEISANKPLVGRYDRGDSVSQQKLQRNLMALGQDEDDEKILVRVRAEQLTSEQAKKVAADADERRDRIEGPLKKYDAAYLHQVPVYEKDAAGKMTIVMVEDPADSSKKIPSVQNLFNPALTRLISLENCKRWQADVNQYGSDEDLVTERWATSFIEQATEEELLREVRREMRDGLPYRPKKGKGKGSGAGGGRSSNSNRKSRSQYPPSGERRRPEKGEERTGRMMVNKATGEKERHWPCSTCKAECGDAWSTHEPGKKSHEAWAANNFCSVLAVQ